MRGDTGCLFGVRTDADTPNVGDFRGESRWSCRALNKHERVEVAALVEDLWEDRPHRPGRCLQHAKLPAVRVEEPHSCGLHIPDFQSFELGKLSDAQAEVGQEGIPGCGIVWGSGCASWSWYSVEQQSSERWKVDDG